MQTPRNCSLVLGLSFAHIGSFEGIHHAVDVWEVAEQRVIGARMGGTSVDTDVDGVDDLAAVSEVSDSLTELSSMLIRFETGPVSFSQPFSTTWQEPGVGVVLPVEDNRTVVMESAGPSIRACEVDVAIAEGIPPDNFCNDQCSTGDAFRSCAAFLGMANKDDGGLDEASTTLEGAEKDTDVESAAVLVNKPISVLLPELIKVGLPSDGLSA